MSTDASPPTGASATPDPGLTAPLAGVVVVDLTRALAGPQATMMLGDLGARVIKVESAKGDDTRGYGPPFVGPSTEPVSTYFLSCNRNKESIVLDLTSDDGRRTLTRLVRHADVLAENFRPGVMERLGFSWPRIRELNPAMVVLRISGFGEDGPQGGRPGYDQIAQGEAGLMSLTGSAPDDPQRVGVPIADLLAGMQGAYGVVTALLERERTGVGRLVRTSLLAAIVGAHAFQGTAYTVAGEVPRARGNRHPSISPYGLFQCRDGAFQVACGSEGLWRRFAEVLGIDPDAPGMASNAERVRHPALVDAAIDAALEPWGRDDLLAALDDAGVPAGRLRTLDEVYSWDQVAAQHLVMDVEHPLLGTVRLPGSPIRFDDNSFGGGAPDHLPPPRLGEHNQVVRDWLDTMDAATADDVPG